ncbi:phosphotransferase family protein [Nonomuraea sp. NPDC050783]|uniref:phosphotransferase family protein n=1 Tax=Nonomuraea sp. NPDC050783 TaxID=3154634 RepID=UPI00346702BF
MSSATAEVAFDLRVLEQLLLADGIEVEGPLAAARVGLGQSNLTYRVTDRSGRRWIVRRPPRGRLLASAHDVLREYRILSALRDTRVPVPATVSRFEDERLASTPVVVMEHVDGLVVDREETAASLGSELRAALGPSLATALARVHEVDVDQVGLGDLSSRAPYAARQLKRWSRQWQESRTRDLPKLDALTALLQTRMPDQRDESLVHGDFHMRNVIVDPDHGTVRAILDWELSTLGDPMADVGSLLAYWPEAGESRSFLFGASALPGFARRQELAEAYLKASGRDGADLAYWHVFGLWKIAVIGEGILRRALDDPRNAAEGGPPTTRSIDAVVDQAWHHAEAGGLIGPK